MVFCHPGEPAAPVGVVLVALSLDGRAATVSGGGIDHQTFRHTDAVSYRTALTLALAGLDKVWPVEAGVQSAPIWPAGVAKMLVAAAVAKTAAAKHQVVGAAVRAMVAQPVRSAGAALQYVFGAASVTRVAGCAGTFRVEGVATNLPRPTGCPTPVEVAISAATMAGALRMMKKMGADPRAKEDDRQWISQMAELCAQNGPGQPFSRPAVLLSRLFSRAVPAGAWSGIEVGGEVFWRVVWPEILRAFVAGVGCEAARLHLARNAVELPAPPPPLKATLRSADAQVAKSLITLLFPSETPDDHRRINETLQKVAWLAKTKTAAAPLTQVLCFAGGAFSDPRRDGSLGGVLACPLDPGTAVDRCIALAGTTKATPADVFLAGLHEVLAVVGTTLAEVAAGLHRCDEATLKLVAGAAPECLRRKDLARNNNRMAAAVIVLGVTKEISKGDL